MLAGTGMIAVLATMFFSESRNTWVTFAVLSIFFILYLTREKLIQKRIVSIIGILLLLSSSYLLPTVKVRVDYAIKDVYSYVYPEYPQQDFHLFPIGTRLELWKAGWKVFPDNPLLGVGTGGLH